jgi:histidyl-tRNA synthetase
MGYADKLGIPFVAFLGEDEIAQGKIYLKNMQSGEQQLLSLEEAVRLVQEDLRVRDNGKLILG